MLTDSEEVGMYVNNITCIKLINSVILHTGKRHIVSQLIWKTKPMLKWKTSTSQKTQQKNPNT